MKGREERKEVNERVSHKETAKRGKIKKRKQDTRQKDSFSHVYSAAKRNE